MNKILLGCGVALIASLAAAQPTPPGPPPGMDDKAMTRAEMMDKLHQHFGMMDTNKDGVISKDEIDAQMADWHDKDGHGMAMHEGPMGDPKEAFDRLDTNRDGVLSRDEFAKGREMRIERRIVMKDGDGKAGHKAMKMRMHGGMGGHMMMMADTDHDGKITLAEAEAMAMKHFDEMDANHDGTVTPEERRAAHPMIMKWKEKKMEHAPQAG